LADARDLARDHQRAISKGNDPSAEKRGARTAVTFGRLAEEYVARHAKPHKRSWKEDQRQLEAELLPRWRHRAADEITRRDVREVLDTKVLAGAPIAANRLRALISKVYNFGIEVELVEHNPVNGLKRPGKEKKRERVLTSDEIRRVWNACDTQSARVAAWFRLRLVTGQRGGELLQMRWRDVDQSTNWWTIPAEFVKNGHGHRVFLGPLARQILYSIPRHDDSVWVFPLSLMGDHKHVARRLAQRTRANMVGNGTVSPGKRLRADFTGHDLRRTAASFMASGGVARFIISRLLNHSSERDITGVYDRYSYDSEKRAALEFWDRQLTLILSAEFEGASDSFITPTHPGVDRATAPLGQDGSTASKQECPTI
jgi:integrase